MTNAPAGNLLNKFIGTVVMEGGRSHVTPPVDTEQKAHDEIAVLLQLLGNPPTLFVTVSQVVSFVSPLMDALDA